MGAEDSTSDSSTEYSGAKNQHSSGNGRPVQSQPFKTVLHTIHFTCICYHRHPPPIVCFAPNPRTRKDLRHAKPRPVARPAGPTDFVHVRLLHHPGAEQP